MCCLELRLKRTVESVVARANMSAQGTVIEQAFPSADLISSMTSNPQVELQLGFDLFSPMHHNPALST